MNSFSFPFKSNNNNKTSPASAEEFFEALSMESDGFYPFGVNEFWHGGVHVTNQSSGALKQGDGIQCIADGEVVAYRINEKHIDTPAYEKPGEPAVNIPYSSSFTLVRHELEYPAKSGNKLPIFSLYMHLLPWNGYVQAKTQPTQYRIKSSNMRKVEKGAIVKGKVGIITLLPAGAIVELSGKKIGNYHQVSKIVSGVTPKPDQLGWIYKTTYSKIKHSIPEGKKAPDYLSETIYKVKNTASDTESFAKDVKGVRGRISATGGEVLALYPRWCELKLENFAKGAKRAKVLEVISGSPTQQAGKTAKGYVWLEDMEAKTKPPEFDKVITLSKPIKKGDKIGYMGQFCTPEKPKNRPVLHWEIFAGDNLKAFISRARDANGKAKRSEKTILKIPKGTKLISPNALDADASISSNAVIVKMKTQGDYTQYTTVANSAKVSRSLLGTWNKSKKYYTPQKESYAALTKLLGITVDKSSHFPLLKQHDGGMRTIQIPQTKSETLWLKKGISLTALNNNKYLVTSTSNAWTKYPESFEIELTTVEKDICMKLSEIKNKKQDEQKNEWYEVMLTQNNACTLGYIDSSKLSYHTPEEFICFTGSDIKGGSDASFHKDADSYWKNRFAPITRENSKDEDDSPVSNFRLSLHPFATEVFKHKGKEHGSLKVYRKIHP